MAAWWLASGGLLYQVVCGLGVQRGGGERLEHGVSGGRWVVEDASGPSVNEKQDSMGDGWGWVLGAKVFNIIYQ